jgi:uncharacterized protein YjiS (DUF1127 family)
MNVSNCTHTISWHTAPPELVPSWRQWLEVGRRKAGRDLIEVLDVVAAWSQRARERRQLLTLDERMLKDIGANRADAWQEARKPFWRK